MPKQAPPDNESKNARFRRLAEERAQSAVKFIRRIGTLAGPSYEYSPEEVDKLEAYLIAEIEAMGIRLRSRTQGALPGVTW